jgi:arylsulfatase A-like enzyme
MFNPNSKLLFTGCSVIIAGTFTYAQPKKPNVIVILADDLGYMDVNYFATKVTGTPANKQYYETPNLNRLAEQGVAFQQAYSCPLSAPTRASVLTGKYASRLGFQTATAGGARTYYSQGLEAPAGFHEQDCYWSDNIENKAAILNGNTLIALPSGQPQDKGRDEITFAEAMTDYNSGFIGKWHLGGHGSEGYQPRNQGFEEIAYHDSGSSPYFNWKGVWNRKEKHFPKMRQAELQQGKAGELSGKEYLTDDLTEQALSYIDNQTSNKSGKPFLLYYCPFAVHSPNQAPAETIKYFENKATKGWNGHVNATYAAMIKHLDLSVGKIMAKLEEKGISENTLIIFLSDNGGITVGAGDKEVITNNSPLTGQKANVYEGGIRVPMIVSYKGTVKGKQFCNIPVDCNDIFPTLLEISGQPKATHPIDGQSIAGLLKDTKNKSKTYTRETHFWHYPLTVVYKNPEDNLAFTPHSAVRKGDYKLIFDWYGRLRLFNLKNDMSEKVNLAKKMPVKTRELFAELMNYLEKNVEKKYWPRKNPNYDVAKEAREIPYTDLYEAYKAGKDIVELAN